MDIGLSGAVYKRLIFHTPNAADAPLRVNISHAPQNPAPGQDCELQISVFRGTGETPQIFVSVLSVTNLTGDIPAQNSDVVITNVTTSNKGLTRQWNGIVRANRPVQAVFRIVADKERKYTINFSGVIPPLVDTPLPRPDTNDVHGPIVISTLPPEGGEP